MSCEKCSDLKDELKELKEEFKDYKSNLTRNDGGIQP